MIKYLVDDLKTGASKFHKILFIKNPCKTCVVKACCSEKCDINHELDLLLFPCGSLGWIKFNAWAIVMSFLVLILSIVFAIVKS